MPRKWWVSCFQLEIHHDPASLLAACADLENAMEHEHELKEFADNSFPGYEIMFTDIDHADPNMRDKLDACPVRLGDFRPEDLLPNAPKRPVCTHCRPVRHIFCKACMDRSLAETGVCPMCQFGDGMLDGKEAVRYQQMLEFMTDGLPPERITNLEQAKLYHDEALTYTNKLDRAHHYTSEEIKVWRPVMNNIPNVFYTPASKLYPDVQCQDEEFVHLRWSLNQIHGKAARIHRGKREQDAHDDDVAVSSSCQGGFVENPVHGKGLSEGGRRAVEMKARWVCEHDWGGRRFCLWALHRWISAAICWDLEIREEQAYLRR
jgi:hypothetical protein